MAKRPARGARKARGEQAAGRGRRVGKRAGRKSSPGPLVRAWRWIVGWTLRAGLAVMVVAAGYFVWLDLTVRPAFDGKRWALPARLYARPLELYAGARLTPDQLEQELKLLGYEAPAGGIEALQRPGSFERRDNGFYIASRGFDFWDGHEPERALTVRFERASTGGYEVSDLASSGDAAPIVRLEPLLIGRISPTHNEDRVLVRLQDVPELLPEVLLAVEDRRFHDHMGISPRGLVRAVLANVRAGATVQGGSTLTQQLAKNFFLTHERTWWRKCNEAMLALLLEIHYSKTEILEAYLNEVFLGQQGPRAIHGFGLASRHYFSRPVSELDLDEIALLVAIVKGASYYNPRRHPERALNRRNLVLNMLAELGVVTVREAEIAKQSPLGVTARPGSAAERHPAFLDLVRRQLRRDYREEDLRAEGIRVFTTLDPIVQASSEQAFREDLAALANRRGEHDEKLEGASVTLNPQTGEVLGVVGGRDPRAVGFNRALDARRPIGSLVKPAVYLTALGDPARYSLATVIEDAPVSVEGPRGKRWTPDNYDRMVHGQVPLYRALARSYNLATVRLGLDVGLEDVAETLHRLGVERPIPPYPSVLLGTLELTPLEVAQVYQTLASGGFRAPVRAIREVTDASSSPLSRYGVAVEQTIDPSPAYLINAALERVMIEGTGRSAYARLPSELRLAGKTGTTDELRDSWFAGFSADRVSVVWLGHDDNSRAGLTGASGALRIWTAMMASMNPGNHAPLAPAGVEWHWTDPLTGQATDPHCGDAIRLPYAQGSTVEYTPCGGVAPVASTVAGDAGVRTARAKRKREPREGGIRNFFGRIFGGDGGAGRQRSDSSDEYSRARSGDQ